MHRRSTLSAGNAGTAYYAVPRGTGHCPVPTAIVFVILMLAGICGVPRAFADDKIVAVVNKDIVTLRDMRDYLNFTRVQLSRQYQGRQLEEKVQAVKLDLLDRLIEDRLILQEAQKSSIHIDENRIKARINDVKRQYLTDAEFQADLAKQGMVPADLERKFREQFMIFAVIDTKVKSKITVRPEEVTRFYNDNLKDFFSQETRELEAYAFDDEDPAKTFAYNLSSGQKLVDLAARYIFTINKLKVSRQQEVKKEIADTVFVMEPGEISKPVEIDGKFYVFKLENIISPRQQALSEVQDQVNDFLFNKKMEEEFVRWVDGLKKEAYIKVTANNKEIE